MNVTTAALKRKRISSSQMSATSNVEGLNICQMCDLEFERIDAVASNVASRFSSIGICQVWGRDDNSWFIVCRLIIVHQASHESYPLLEAVAFECRIGHGHAYAVFAEA